jgi:drug/metabolite transporter (DMT)-like permease
MPSSFSQSFRYYLAALGTVLIWATAFAATRITVNGISPQHLALGRNLVACGLFALVMMKKQFYFPPQNDWGPLAGLGFLGIGLYQLCFALGLRQVEAGTAGMITASVPVISAILAFLLWREQLPTRAIVGIAVSFGGIALISWRKGIGGQADGMAWLLLAACCYALYFTLQKPLLARYGPIPLVSWATWSGTLPLLWFLPSFLQELAQATSAILGAVFYLGSFPSGIALLLWSWALRHLPIAHVCMFLFLQPLFTIAIAYIWLRELPDSVSLIGGMVILIGMGLVIKKT